jgi:hypothetical protein
VGAGVRRPGVGGASSRDAIEIRGKYAEGGRVAGPMPFDPEWELGRLARDRFVIADPAASAQMLADVVRRTRATDLVLRSHFRGMDPERALRRWRSSGTRSVPGCTRCWRGDPCLTSG